MFALVVAVVLGLAWWAASRRQQSSVPRRGTVRKHESETAAQTATPPNSVRARATAPTGRAFLYDAFISYRHVKSDKRWARWLHLKLESYRTPAELVAAGVLPRTGRIFRDEEELAATGDLPETIQNALANSHYLFVLCSPAATTSKWIAAEIEFFREHRRLDHILPVLIDGTIATALPAALIAPSEGKIDGPLVVTLPGGVRSHRARQIGLLRLLAPLLRCKFDDLRNRDQVRARRRARQTGVATAAVVLVLGLLLWRSENSFIHELAVHSETTRNVDSSLSLLLSREGFARAVRLRHWFGQDLTESRRALEADVVTSRLRGAFEMPGPSVQSVVWTDDNNIVASDYGGNVYVWQRATGKRIASHRFTEGIQQFVARSVAGNLTLVLVTGGAWRLPGGALVLGQNAHRKLYVWNTVTGNIQSVDIPDYFITQQADLSWCADRVAVVVGSADVFFFRTAPLRADGQVDGEQLVHEDWGEANAISWDAACSRLALGTSQGLYLLSAVQPRHRRLAESRRGDGNEVSGVISVDWFGENAIAAGARDRTATIWTIPPDQATNAETAPSPPAPQIIGGHAGAVTVIRHGPGDRLATGSADGTVRIWRRSDWGIYEAEVFFYPYRTARVNGIAWGPGGTEIATAGEDSTVRIWNIRIDRNVTLGKNSGTLSLSEQRELRFQGRAITDDELSELGRQRTFRQLTRDECRTYLHSLWVPWCPVI